MKKNITLIAVFLIATMYSQTIKIDYLYNESSGKCIEEKHQVQFINEKYFRTDLYDNSRTWTPSRKSKTGYTENNMYYEIWSPKFYLDLYGIDEYRKVYQYLVKVIYNKRGGSVLYVIETNLEDNNSSKCFITEIGKKYFCDN